MASRRIICALAGMTPNAANASTSAPAARDAAPA